MVPLWVLASINADIGAPLLRFADFDPDEGVHLVEWTTTIDVQMRRDEVKSQPTSRGNDKRSRLWLHDNLWLWLNNNLWLWLHDNLRLWLDNNGWLSSLRTNILNIILMEN